MMMEKRIPIKLIKDGLQVLIDTDSNSLINNLALLLREKPAILDYLYTGPLVINDDIRASIKEYLLNTLANPESLLSIDNIEVSFNYDLAQDYTVTYTLMKYYSADGRPYGGLAVKDEAHPISKATKEYTSVNPSEL